MNIFNCYKNIIVVRLSEGFIEKNRKLNQLLTFILGKQIGSPGLSKCARDGVKFSNSLINHEKKWKSLIVINYVKGLL